MTTWSFIFLEDVWVSLNMIIANSKLIYKVGNSGKITNMRVY